MTRTPMIVMAAGLIGAACAAGHPPEPQRDPARLGHDPDADTCGAAEFVQLIGEHKDRAPPSGSRANYRLASTEDPITFEHIPGRLNIFYDPRSLRIVGVRCF